MTLYRRGSVTVEAIRVSDILNQNEEGSLPAWVVNALDANRLVIRDGIVEVLTPEGWSAADTKSMIVQRQTEAAELYPIKGATFWDPKAGYTRVE